MGTRSTIKFYDGEDYICGIYQQYDGYPSGVGLKLANFLKNIEIINGFNSQKIYEHANGFCCLIAQFISKFKTSIGNLYMTTKDDTQDFDYVVKYFNGKYEIMIYSYDRVCFQGDIDKFLEYCEEN